MDKKAPFVTVEGVDGAGKSSHIKTIVKALEDAGWKVILTREPGGTPLAEEFRHMILREEMALTTEIMLAFTARAEHIDKVIKPSLEAGIAVVCDRFTDSTYAYQGMGRKGDLELIEMLEQKIHGDLTPDMTLLFDLPISVSKKRLEGTGKIPDKFESQNEIFFEDVRKGYQQRVAQSERFVVIDSSVPVEEVSQNVENAMNDFVANNFSMVKKNKSKLKF